MSVVMVLAWKYLNVTVPNTDGHDSKILLLISTSANASDVLVDFADELD